MKHKKKFTKMKKTFILFAAVAVAIPAAAAPPDAQGAERKVEICGASADSIVRQWQQEQAMTLAQNSAGFGWQGAPPADSAGKQQRHQQRQAQMQAQKVGYFTAQLELTPEEAERFWPVYNEYWKKRSDLFQERNNLIRNAKHDKVDDKKALQMAQRMVGNLQDDANLAREYNEKFAKVLPPQKLLKYYVAEESFRVELLNVLRKPKKDVDVSGRVEMKVKKKQVD